MNYHRACFHDYKQPGMYMITMTLLPHAWFSKLSGTPNSPVLNLNSFGEAVEWELRQIHEHEPSVFINTSILMPDHLHMQLTVANKLNRGIGAILAGFKSKCSQHFTQINQLPDVQPVFKKDFHDRIIFNNDQLETVQNYIADNPRRLLIKRSHPDLFKVYNHLRIGNREFAAYGNIFLLRDFQLQQVRIHRAWSTTELDNHRGECYSCASTVSPSASNPPATNSSFARKAVCFCWPHGPKTTTKN